jgi:hypothetical protein
MSTLFWTLGVVLVGVWIVETAVFVLSYRLDTRSEDGS